MLTIVSIGYPLAPLGPDSVGGAEQVLSVLDRGIIAARHRSLVIAPDGSVCRGELVATARVAGPLDAAAVHVCHESCRRQIAHVLAREHVDIVHMHGVDFLNYMPKSVDIPVLATLHVWPSAYPPGLFAVPRPNLHLQCVSYAQQRACPAHVPTLVIRNGVDLRTFRPDGTPSDYALVLGRVCADKGVHLAIDAAQAAGMPILIGGAVFPYPAHQHYFAAQIAPRLNARVRFLGPMGGAAKLRALAAARCLLLTSVVPETSSLVAMEALASGTPVVALRSPAVSELIEHGRTGLLVDDPADLPAALRRVGMLSRRACRDAAVQRCGVDRMVREYLATYHRLAAEHEPPPAARASAPCAAASQ